MRFFGKVVLVTGAGSGIGLATAMLFAALGARVAVNDIDESAASAAVTLINGNGHTAFGHAADIANHDAVAAMVGAIVAEHGSIDILVNNAGILRSTPFLDISASEWELVIRADLTGAFLCSSAAAPHMIERGYGKIVNVASMAGRATSTLGGAHYTAAKAGLLGLSRHMARELAPHKINVNAVCPGIVDTGMTQKAMDTRRTEQVLRTIPLGRLAEPGEIAELICFLASPEASYITGASVDIHGGELIIA